MAYTATVIKGSVSRTAGEDDFIVTIHVAIEDETPAVVLEEDFSERWNSNIAISAVYGALAAQIQAAWDKYVEELNIFNSAAFDTLVSDIGTAADTYINL